MNIFHIYAKTRTTSVLISVVLFHDLIHCLYRKSEYEWWRKIATTRFAFAQKVVGLCVPDGVNSRPKRSHMQTAERMGGFVSLAVCFELWHMK